MMTQQQRTSAEYQPPYVKEENAVFGLFIGTYAAESETGIHYARFDAGSGELTLAGGTSGIENPSFLHFDRGRSVLYAVSEAAGREGEAASYAWSRGENRLQPLGKQPSHGVFPCHVRPHPRGTILAVANYGSGGIAIYPLKPEGAVGTVACRIEEEGSGPNENRQEGPHPHSVNWSPDGRFLYVPDLGSDKIRAYRLEAGGAASSADNPEALRLTPASAVGLKPGAGPRHMVFHPHLPVAYSIQELNSTVARFRIGEGTGQLSCEEVLSTLPDNYRERNDSADLHLSRDGNYLYASNRGHDSIAVYAAAPEDGRLTLLEIVPTGGRNPRNFALSPDGAYLLCANQGSDSITVFRRDPATGRLAPTESRLAGVKQPVCLEWE